MKSVILSTGAFLGTVAVICAGWWFLSSPPTQAGDHPGHFRESGNPHSDEAVAVSQNPRRGFDTHPAPSPADTGCYVLRADMDHSGGVDIADLTYLVDHMFRSGPLPVCEMEGDVDASGELDISDLTYLIDYMFLGGPAPPVPAGIDYVVYCRNAGSSEKDFFGYHVLTHEIDSFSLNFPASPISHGLSADGKKLYVPDGDSTAVINVASTEVETWLPFGSIWGQASSPNGEVLTLFSQSTVILRTSDYSVLYQDSLPTKCCGKFSANSDRLYCIATNEQFYNQIYSLDLEGDYTGSWIPFTGGSVLDFGVSPDESRIFGYLHYGLWSDYFQVYDSNADSIIFSEFIEPGAGNTTVDPLGRLAFYSNPGTIFPGPPPPSYFTAYDIANNTLFDTISLANTVDCIPGVSYIPVGEMVITPDGRWLVGLGAFYLPVFILVDMSILEIVDCKYVGGNHSFFSLRVQSSP